MPERFFQRTFDNGFTLLAEKMPGMQSAAMTLLIPAGSATDPPDGAGSATVLSDLILRGAGQRDSRQLTDYLDSLGLQRTSSVGVYHTRLSCAAVAGKVMESLAAYADVVRRPLLPEAGFQAARDLSLQSLEALEDDPHQKLTVNLRQWFYPSPLGRNPMGSKQDLELMTSQFCRADWRQRYHARGSILAMAGNVDFGPLSDEVARQFRDFGGPADEPIKLAPPPGLRHHEPRPTEQTHIGMAHPCVPETHRDYYLAIIGAEVLGGGMSGRLFTEVREKRALCYNIWAGYSSLKDRGSILAYAGTSNDRAQATLDCMLAEIRRLAEGITPDELQRAKIGLKSAIIMQGESTPSRSGAIAHDYFIRGRIRTLDEINAAIDGITVEAVNDYLNRNPPGPFTIVTVGPKELKTGS